MATISDVETALRDIIYGALYPTGAAPSLVGYPIKIYAGWPNPQTLDADLVETAGVPAAAHVSIFPGAAERNTSRYLPERQEMSVPAATYTLTLNGSQVTVGGAAPSPYFAQNFAILVNGKPYTAQATAGQTPSQVAAALRAAIAVDFPSVTVAGAVLTLPSSLRIGALRVGVTGTAIREVKRQERQFWIGVYASNPAARAAIADAIDPTLGDVRRITMPDGSVARLTYHGTREDDFLQKARIYRRTLTYVVEFATTITDVAAQMVAGETDTFDAAGRPISTTYS